MTFDGKLRVFWRHPHPVVFHNDQFFPAEVDGDGDAGGTGIERILDELLDDRGWTLHDLAGGNLVREIRRKAVDAIHSQSCRLKAASIPVTVTTQMPTIHQNCALSGPGRCGITTFIPYNPVNTVSGMKMVDITVRTFMI